MTGQPMIPFAELSVITLAAMVPSEIPVRICDEQVGDAELNPAETHVALTGKSNQVQRTLELARHYRSQGKTVMIGGPYASLAPEVYEGECDILVTGELEDQYVDFFRELQKGETRPRYDFGRADITKAPIPRWDLYPNGQTTFGTLQTSRGCPFACEFCDVIQYAGRKQRFKDSAQILDELESVSDQGYRQLFLIDDNFTASRPRSKEILETLAFWNKVSMRERTLFFTQLSIDASRDTELLEMCARAGLHRAFVGIETPNVESLKETKKFQNLKGDLKENVETLLRYGLGVYSGIIIGFDHDTPATFQQQRDFLNQSPIAAFSAGALIAYRSTPLYARMVKDGRVDPARGDATLMPWESNMAFKNFTEDVFTREYLKFIKDTFSAEAFGQRMLRALDLFGQEVPFIFDFNYNHHRLGLGATRFHEVIGLIRDLGLKESAMVDSVLRAGQDQPLKLIVLSKYLYCFYQTRFMFRELWNGL